MEEQVKPVAALLRALANEHRLLILCALAKGPRSVTELMEYVPHIGQSALSQHLALLRAHGIVESQKEGMHVIYRVADARVNEVLQVLRRNYCP